MRTELQFCPNPRKLPKSVPCPTGTRALYSQTKLSLCSFSKTSQSSGGPIQCLLCPELRWAQQAASRALGFWTRWRDHERVRGPITGITGVTVGVMGVILTCLLRDGLQDHLSEQAGDCELFRTRKKEYLKSFMWTWWISRPVIRL